MLIDLCDLLDYAQNCLELLGVLQHSDQDCLEMILQEVLRLLSCLVLPLYYLMPNGTAKLHHLNDKIQNRLSLRGHDQRHCFEFILRLFLRDFQYNFCQLIPLFYLFDHHAQGFLHADPQKCLNISSIGRNREIIKKDYK